jgi:Fic family protein
VQSEIINITPFDNGNGRIGRLLSYLFLYRAGLDFRGMLNLEEYYKRDIITYKRMLDQAKIQGNMTTFIEYFALGVKTSLEVVLENIKNEKFQDNLPAKFWKLNSRQRSLMQTLENPEEKISNKDIQKRFGVSQITASRDLTHLSNLGLLLAHGKGRSVYYTKV